MAARHEADDGGGGRRHVEAVTKQLELALLIDGGTGHQAAQLRKEQYDHRAESDTG
jgi:hypothetical protein